MKRAKTIIKKIYDLEYELYNNFPEKEIMKAIEELEKQKYINNYSTCIDMIYSGCYDYVKTTEMEEKNNE